MKKYLYILCGLICLQSALAFDATVFPTLAGLSRTRYNEFIGGDGDECGQNNTQLLQPNKEVVINGKQYLEFGGWKMYLREADNKVYMYSGQGTEDLVLYDYTLGVGDVLHRIQFDMESDEGKFVYADEFLTVTKMENITLLDGKEYKKWTFDNGIMEYVETIGSFGGTFAGDFFQLVELPIPTCMKQCHLVCASRDGQLLYEMPQEKQEQLHTYCMSSPKVIQANQWNVFEIQAYIDRLVIYEFTLSSDTVINNITYTKVMQRATLTSDAPTYAAAIRQENDKVFVCYDSKEYLLYDFGAKAGDEILIWGGLDHPTTLCKNIVKDVQVADDGKRILNIEIVDRTDVPEEEQLHETAQWIEGIGSTHGLLYTGVTYVGGSFHYLQCAYTNGVQVYERTGDTFAQYGCEYNSDHTYFPEGKVWSYRITEYCDGGEKTFIHHMSVSGEKTINGVKYRMLNETPIRESGKKVFALSDNKEVLIYDFGLEVGDKIGSPSALLDNDEGLATVTAVDSVTLLDGRRAKRIQYDLRRTDIEYIGSIAEAGVLAPLYGEEVPTCGPIDFLCCSYNGQPLYETSSGSCDNIDAALDHTTTAPQAVKYLLNGQLFFQLGEQSYDVLGRPVSLLNE